MRWGVAVAVAALAMLARAAGADVLPSDVIVVEDVGGKIQAAAGPLPDAYLGAAACAAFKQVDDAFDAMFVFTTIPQGFMSATPAAATVRQTTKGIGKPTVNQSAKFCSVRLRHSARMGDIAALPDDPDARYDPGPGGGTGLSGVEVMGHEFGHHWMAYVGYDLGDGTGRHCNIRSFAGGSDSPSGDCDGYTESSFGVHWSPYFGSGGVMFGNKIEDLGNGTFRFGGPGGFFFGRLDQYLMGLRLAEQVGPLLLVKPEPGSGIEPGDYPIPPGEEKVVAGYSMGLGIDDIIRAEGERFPPAEPCHWKGALVLVHAQGKPPAEAAIAKVAAYGKRFESWYPEATEGLGSFDLTRDGRGAGTAACPAPGHFPVPDETEPAPEPVPEAVAESGPDAWPDMPADHWGGGDAPADVVAWDLGGEPAAAADDGGPADAASRDVAGDSAPGTSGGGPSGGGCRADAAAAPVQPLLVVLAVVAMRRRRTD